MDIVPIQLSLTAGDLITLWAPRWREAGEEWEGFLGDADAVHAFPDAAALAAYVRTVPTHDLSDHPSWPLVLQLSAPELVPEEDQCYDLVGVPEIVAEEPDTWTVSELASIATLVRSLADTCDLPAVHHVLNASEGFALLERGSWAFHGREGGQLWEQLGETIVNRWDEVVDALDAVVVVPEVEPAALAAARRELITDPDRARTHHAERLDAPPADTEPAEAPGPRTDAAPDDAHPRRGPDGAPAATPAATPPPTNFDTASRTGLADGGPADADAAAPAQAPTPAPIPSGTAEPSDEPAPTGVGEFWESVGIDPILINLDGTEHYTLRCYLHDKPVFLGREGRIFTLPSPVELAAYLAERGADGHDLLAASTWQEVIEAAKAGELAIAVDPQNAYHLDGLGEDLLVGPTEVDPTQLDLGVELLLDVGEWAGDSSAENALRPSESLGWLTSFILRPDPTRLAPSPPFDAEVTRWNGLVADLAHRLRHP